VGSSDKLEATDQRIANPLEPRKRRTLTSEERDRQLKDLQFLPSNPGGS
jgi:hypothetical protein